MNLLAKPATVLLLVAIAGVISFYFGIKANRRVANQNKRAQAWPAFVDIVVSGLVAGLSSFEALELAVARAPAPLAKPLLPFARSLKSESLVEALKSLSAEFSLEVVDEFCQLIRINQKLGGQGLVPILKTHSKRARSMNASRASATSRKNATITMAKLGVTAPWILLGLLLTRSESSSAFETAEGIAILLGGFAVCVAAYRIILFIAKPPVEVRIYG